VTQQNQKITKHPAYQNNQWPVYMHILHYCKLKSHQVIYYWHVFWYIQHLNLHANIHQSKKARHYTLTHNFSKYWPLFKILPLAVKSSLNNAPHLNNVTTLPCEISIFKQSPCSRTEWKRLPYKTKWLKIHEKLLKKCSCSDVSIT